MEIVINIMKQNVNSLFLLYQVHKKSHALYFINILDLLIHIRNVATTFGLEEKEGWRLTLENVGVFK